MKNKIKKINKRRQKRANSVRSKIKGTEITPRLSIFRSNKYIYAQLIDDFQGKTICSYSSINFKKENKEKMNKTKEAEMIGEKLAEIAGEKSIKNVIFDRGWYKYHGRVKSLIEGFRKKFK